MRSTIGVAIAVVAIVAIVAIAGDWTSVGCRYFHGPPVASWRPLFFGAAILHGGGPEFFETAGRNANLSTELDGWRPSAPVPYLPKAGGAYSGLTPLLFIILYLSRRPRSRRCREMNAATALGRPVSRYRRARVRRNSRGRPLNAPAVFIHQCQPIIAKQPPFGPGWAHELKHDGYRLHIHIRDGRMRLYTINGANWSKRYFHSVAASGPIRATPRTNWSSSRSRSQRKA